MTLKQIAKAIAENCEAVHNDKIEWEIFDKRNKELWAMAHRNEPCIIGSNAARRQSVVMDELKRLRAIR